MAPVLEISKIYGRIFLCGNIRFICSGVLNAYANDVLLIDFGTMNNTMKRVHLHQRAYKTKYLSSCSNVCVWLCCFQHLNNACNSSFGTVSICYAVLMTCMLSSSTSNRLVTFLLAMQDAGILSCSLIHCYTDTHARDEWEKKFHLCCCRCDFVCVCCVENFYAGTTIKTISHETVRRDQKKKKKIATQKEIK